MKSIKRLLLLLFCGFSILSYAQEHRMRVGLNYGFLYGGCSHQFDKSELGWMAGADISYFFTKHFFITLHISEGAFNYTNNANFDDGTKRNEHGTMSMGTLGLLAGYHLPLTSWSNISGQIGFAQFSLLDEYQYTLYTPNEERLIGYDVLISNNYHTTFSASIPVKFTLGFTPFKKMDVGLVKNIEIGYTCGLDIEPDFGFFTFFYHGPQLSISF